jgi:hypothetical protein
LFVHLLQQQVNQCNLHLYLASQQLTSQQLANTHLNLVMNLIDPDDDPDDGILANPKPQNEHLGVDDEEMYFPTPNTHVGGDDVGEESGSDTKSDSESDVEYEEEDGLIGQDPLPPVPIVAYDRDDPPMSVGSIYPNMEEFRLTLSQHDIKYEFEFNIEKSDPERMRVYCLRKNEDKCKWRLYASADTDGVSIKVISYYNHIYLLIKNFINISLMLISASMQTMIGEEESNAATYLFTCKNK